MNALIAMALFLTSAASVAPTVSGPATAPVYSCPAKYSLYVAMGGGHWVLVPQPRTVKVNDYRTYRCFAADPGSKYPDGVNYAR